MQAAGPDLMELVAALIPALLVLGMVIAGFTVGGMRAARLQRLIERQTEELQRQTALLQRLETRLTDPRKDT
ncbi:hypothetical protein [Vannielia sp.]|uniref:hypothetical protein n=1 Tax=Vannielia sp. TaxID=2813045 RepID=UPI00261DC928|nr:hypothetical protein [Vannielia sp.]MDF1872577.1 hypothetical protein [Vannielia sp.]